MAKDIRQVMAAVLTLSMFVMLGNMIKRDHFDTILLQVPATITGGVENDVMMTFSKQSLAKLGGLSKGLQINVSPPLKPCWNKPSSSSSRGRYSSHGFITFSLTNGPEYHVSQVANAVLVARYLGATLVIPDIIGSKPEDKMSFEQVYDVEKFLQSLAGIVRAVGMKDVHQPLQTAVKDNRKVMVKAATKPQGRLRISSGKRTAIRVPERISEEYIAMKIEPVFRKTGNLRLLTYFPAVSMENQLAVMRRSEGMDSYSCLAMFESLQLQQRLQGLVGFMVEKLRKLSQAATTSNGQFIAVDLNPCDEGSGGGGENGGCYNAREIGEFLMEVGFQKDTIVYLTHSGRNNTNNLDPLRHMYANTYTKEEIIMGDDSDTKWLDLRSSSELEKAIDFYICIESDVFIPTFMSMFYAAVAGRRIALGRTRVLIPPPASLVNNSSSTTDYISSYISKKNHPVYSCFCKENFMEKKL